MIGIVDYGVGNLFSLKSSFAFIGAEAVVSASPEELAACDRVVLPGVGAFADAARKLRVRGARGPGPDRRRRETHRTGHRTRSQGAAHRMERSTLSFG